MPQGTKTNVRVNGFAVTIHGFIEVPKGDIGGQIKTLAAVDEAIKSGDPAKLVALMELDADGIIQKNVNRMVPEDEYLAKQAKREADAKAATEQSAAQAAPAKAARRQEQQAA